MFVMKTRLKDHYIARARRIALNMTQAELGEKIGKSGAWVSLFERGKIDDQGMIPVIFNTLSNVSKDWTEEAACLLVVKTDCILMDIYKRYDGEVPKDLVKLLKMHCIRYGQWNF